MTELSNRVKMLRREKKELSLSEVAYEQIKEAIVLAKFKPGEFISENMMATALEMSRTPVREALRELTYENLVEIIPGRGAVVKDISLKELKEIFALRQVLESFAVEDAVDRITGDEIAELEEIWQGFYEQVQQRKKIEPEIISECDHQLHNMIIRKCDNTYLHSFMDILSQQIRRYQLLVTIAHGDMADTIRQHLEIIDLLKARDKEKLTQVLRHHIKTSEAALIKQSVLV